MSALKDRIVLVTGASRGIGYAIAKAAAAAGAQVIAIARTQGGLEALDDEIRQAGAGAASLVPLDLRDREGIEKLGEIIAKRWGRLDGLVVNAGVLGPLTPASQISAKAWNEVLAVNLIAPARFIRAFEPLLHQSDAGRAVFTTSGAAVSRRALWGAYAASKAGLDALAQSWAKELANTPIRVNLVDPGPVRTPMRAKAAPSEDPNTLPHPEAVAPVFLDLLSPAETRHGDIIKAQGGRA